MRAPIAERRLNGNSRALSDLADIFVGQSLTYDLKVEDMKNLLPFLFMISLVSAPGSKAVDSPPFTRVMESVALVITRDADGRPLGVGSAFAVSDDGKLATNYHVVAGASSAIVKFVGDDERFDVTGIVHLDPELDLAVIQIRRNTKAIPLGDDHLCGIGEPIFALGNPEGLEGTVAAGTLGAFRLLGSDSRLMEITASVSPGSSGGPVLNSRGQVVGIASTSLAAGQELNVALCVSDLKRLLEARPVNVSLSPVNLPVRASNGVASPLTSKDYVQVTDVRRLDSGVAIQISNGLDKDIRNIKVLVTWRTAEGEELHYSPLLISELVAARRNKSVQRYNLDGVGSLDPLRTKADARIIGFETLPSSGSMAFR